jgi:hypothetical protein
VLGDVCAVAARAYVFGVEGATDSVSVLVDAVSVVASVVVGGDSDSVSAMLIDSISASGIAAVVACAPSEKRCFLKLTCEQHYSQSAFAPLMGGRACGTGRWPAGCYEQPHPRPHSRTGRLRSCKIKFCSGDDHSSCGGRARTFGIKNDFARLASGSSRQRLARPRSFDEHRRISRRDPPSLHQFKLLAEINGRMYLSILVLFWGVP